jgi:hypothetical protein
MSDISSTTRQLKLKTGVVKRYACPSLLLSDMSHQQVEVRILIIAACSKRSDRTETKLKKLVFGCRR